MEGSGVAPPSFSSPSSWEVNCPLGFAASLREELSIVNWASARNAAGNSQAGGDGGQDGRNGLNDEFPSFLLHNFEL